MQFMIAQPDFSVFDKDQINTAPIRDVYVIRNVVPKGRRGWWHYYRRILPYNARPHESYNSKSVKGVIKANKKHYSRGDILAFTQKPGSGVSIQPRFLVSASPLEIVMARKERGR